MSVTIEDVRDAARQIEGVVVRTPLLESPALDARVGGRVLIKAETFQRVGAFKFRGAYNRLSRLSDEERRLMELRHQGQDWAAVAAELGGSPEALRKKLTRAVDRVAGELGLDEEADD